MLWRALIAGVLLAAGVAAGQVPSGEKPAEGAAQAAEPVSIDYRFKKGDTFALLLTKTVRIGKGSPQSMTFDIAVEVVDEDEEQGIGISWTQRLGSEARKMMEQARSPAESQLATMLKLADGMRLEFTIESDGSISKIRNFQELLGWMERVFDAIAESKKAEGKDPAGIQKTISIVRETYADEQRATALLLKEPAAYFRGYSFLLTPGEERDSEIELPNGFGGPPFPGRFTCRLVDYDPNAPVVQITGRQTIDHERGRDVLIEVVKSMANRIGKPMPEEEAEKLAKTNLSVDTDLSYRYQRASGLIEFADVTTNLVFGESGRMESIRLKLIDKEKAIPPTSR